MALLLHVAFLPILALSQETANLLPNPSFETPGAGGAPAQWMPSCTGGSQASRDATQAHTGQAAGHILKVADGTSHVAALVFPRIDVEGGAEYALSGWGKGHVPQGQATLFLYQYTREGKYLGSFFHCPVPAATDRWVPLHSIEKVLPECGWVQVRFETYGIESHGEAWVDDVYFGRDTTPPPPVRELNAVGDGVVAQLSWQPPEGEVPAGYAICRSPYARFTPGLDALVGFTQETTLADRMPEGFAHYYAVAAVDAALNLSALVFAGPLRPPGATDLPGMVVWTDGPARRWEPALPWPLSAERRGASLDAARGEWSSLQLLVGAPKAALSNVRVELAELRGPKGAVLDGDDVQVLLQEYVAIAGWGRQVPDPLPPARPVDIQPGMLRGWWVLLHTPESAPAGEYRGRLRATADGRPPIDAAVRLRVWPVTVPQANHYGGSWGIWGEQLAQQEGVQVGSPEYDRLLRRYFGFFLDHRMIPRGLLSPLESDDSVKWLNDPRLASFIIPTPAGWGNVMTEDQVPQFRAQCDRLRANGWLSKGYIYNFDEPTEEQHAHCVEMARRIREAGRDIPILLTEQPEPALFGSVDIWCPLLNIYADTQGRCRDRQKLGEHVWWYVCLAPQPPWPNYLLTNDPIDGRVLSWLQVRYGVEGELYWATTCFPGNVWGTCPQPQWPGDGYLCYPGKPAGLEGPVTCIRAEVIRDAKEDIELIWALRDLARQKGQQESAERVTQVALARVCTDFTHYTKSDGDIAAARQLILQELVRLSRG